MDARTPPATRREMGKAERRRRIVEAAAALLRETGFDGVSMVQIAERAGVVPATLYNLFQTKGAIFRQVFDLDLERYQAQVEAAPARDPIDRIFVAIDIAAGLYRRDPDFYRAMARSGSEGTENLGPAISEPRIAFWQAQTAEAVAQGCLRGETRAEVLGVTLSQIMRGVFLEWTGGAISAERLAKEAAYGFALALLAYATDETSERLKVRLGRLEAALAGDERNR